MIVYRAAWICPITQAPIPNGWFTVEQGRVERVGAPGEDAPAAARDLGGVAVLPGLVNAHTHLELSWLRGRVPPAATFVDWIRQLVITRGRAEDQDDPRVRDAAAAAAREAREFGTAAVGDIGNSLASVEPIRDAGLRGIVFHELLGFTHTNGEAVESTRRMRIAAGARGGDRVRVSLAPHAPYSVSPELFRAIRDEVDRAEVPITSVHLGESASEIQFLADGTGPWPGMLRFIGAMREDWTPPRRTPVSYLDGLGVLDARTLVVHGVELPPADLERLAAIGCTLVTCPRSNQWVGVGVPPLERFYASGVHVAVGTDSLASVDDLNLFAELKTMRWLAPSRPARTLLESATLAGARALGFTDLGSIAPGTRAELVAVTLPPHLHPAAVSGRGGPPAPESVEEHLVSGIDARDIQWVAT